MASRFKGKTAPAMAAAIILIAVFAIMFAMPTIMALVSGAGPLGGVAIAITFMLAFFGVFWLRSRAQKKPPADGG